MDAELTEAETYLSEVATRPKLDHVLTETVALSGSTPSTILDVAHSCQADLIVLCSHGYTGMTRWVLGSVAEKVARHAGVPVLSKPYTLDSVREAFESLLNGDMFRSCSL